MDPLRLGVIARTSAMQFKKTTKRADAIGSELGVSHLIEGSGNAGYEVSVTTVDVSSRQAVHTLVDKATGIGEITGLIHGAGVSPGQARRPRRPQRGQRQSGGRSHLLIERDFVAASDKVMTLDRFDRAGSSDHRATRNRGVGAARLPPRLVRPCKILFARPRLKIRARPASLRMNETRRNKRRLSWRQRKKLCRSALSFPP
jgi:hypothetical protein